MLEEFRGGGSKLKEMWSGDVGLKMGQSQAVVRGEEQCMRIWK